MNYDKFLKEILGENGKKALDNSSDIFKPVIIPRAILSWVNTVGNLGYDGNLPGIQDSFLSLYKNENSFEGALKIKDELFVFEEADLAQVASYVGVALNVELEDLNKSLKNKDLNALGKAIDVLVKTEVIKKSASAPAAEPRSAKEPSEPLKPSKQQPYQKGREVSQLPNIAVGQGQKEEAQKLKITKAEATKECGKCKGKYFENGVFVGCKCLNPLEKAVETKTNPDGYTLVFKVKLPEESLESLIMLLKS